MYNLSFIVCTKNRLPYLKILFDEFFKDILPDEEIVVVDGESTDGSKEFLESLYHEGRIHQFISEPDQNQAQAWNKAMLMAKGLLLKKIMDDDVFSIRGIRECKTYLLDHPSTDICIANSLHVNLLTPSQVSLGSRQKYYQQWKMGQVPSFTFSDADMMIRKSVLSLTGLYDTQFVMIDWEFSLRCSFLKVSMVYYTGNLCLSVYAPGNVSSRASEVVKIWEDRIGRLKYGYQGDNAEMSVLSKFKLFVWRTRKNWNERLAGDNTSKGKNRAVRVAEPPLTQIYKKWYSDIAIAADAPVKFIT